MSAPCWCKQFITVLIAPVINFSLVPIAHALLTLFSELIEETFAKIYSVVTNSIK